MVRLRPRVCRSALDGIEAAHVPGVGIAALGEITSVPCHSGEAGIQKVGIERDDYVGSIELVSGLNRLAKRHLRTRINVVAIHRLVEMPLSFWKFLEQLLLLIGQRGRRKRLRQN